MRSPPARVALVVAAISLACAGTPPARVGETVGALRTRQGVCAGTRYVDPYGAPVRLKGCLRIGLAGTIFDNRDARLVTELWSDDPDAADLTDWQVQVLRDGERILNRALDAGPSHTRCTTGLGCRTHVADVATLEGALGPGTYTLRYRLMSEDAYLSGKQPEELVIVLR